MIEVIAAMDIIDGQCVRLTKGEYDQKTVYDGSPLEVAKRFEAAGVRRLHLVDLDGARRRTLVNLPILETIASRTTLKIDFGGGITSTTDIERVFNAGAEMAVVGSAAIKQPNLLREWLREYGGDRILLAMDVRGESIAINGWQETTSQSIFEQIEQFIPYGLTQFFCTDIDKDGMLDGLSAELYRKLRSSFPQLRRIASGGVSSVADIRVAASVGCHGVIIGKALYERKIDLAELQPFLEGVC